MDVDVASSPAREARFVEVGNLEIRKALDSKMPKSTKTAMAY